MHQLKLNYLSAYGKTEDLGRGPWRLIALHRRSTRVLWRSPLQSDTVLRNLWLSQTVRRLGDMDFRVSLAFGECKTSLTTFLCIGATVHQTIRGRSILWYNSAMPSFTGKWFRCLTRACSEKLWALDLGPRPCSLSPKIESHSFGFGIQIGPF